jgi:hypothetical protein
MGGELSEHQATHFCPGILLLDRPVHLVRAVLPGPPLAHHPMPPARVGFAEHQEMGRAPARLFIAIAGRGPWLHWQRVALLGTQLPAPLSKVALRTARIVGLGLERFAIACMESKD